MAPARGFQANHTAEADNNRESSCNVSTLCRKAFRKHMETKTSNVACTKPDLRKIAVPQPKRPTAVVHHRLAALRQIREGQTFHRPNVCKLHQEELQRPNVAFPGAVVYDGKNIAQISMHDVLVLKASIAGGVRISHTGSRRHIASDTVQSTKQIRTIRTTSRILVRNHQRDTEGYNPQQRHRMLVLASFCFFLCPGGHSF